MEAAVGRGQSPASTRKMSGKGGGVYKVGGVGVGGGQSQVSRTNLGVNHA